MSDRRSKVGKHENYDIWKKKIWLNLRLVNISIIPVYIEMCVHDFRQTSMASYSFPSPGYVNIPPYYNTTPNGYSALNFQYPLSECK